MQNDTPFLNIGYLKDMESHVQLVHGAWDETEENACLISAAVMDTYGLVVGEQLVFPYITDEKEQPLTLTVTGICEEKGTEDAYWLTPLCDYEQQVFVSAAVMDTLLSDYAFEQVYTKEDVLLDYTEFSAEHIGRFSSYITQFQEKDAAFSYSFEELLDDYAAGKQTIATVLWVLELPAIVLLLLFIYMVSGQIVTLEEGEIAALRSRGVTRGQMLRVYVLQASILALLGLLPGLAFGWLLCQLAASADAFLQFRTADVLLYAPAKESIGYALGAAFAAVCCLLLPVRRRAGLTIVTQKKARLRRAGSFWEKSGLDVILLALSLYLLYNYRKQADALYLGVLNGEAIDPLLIEDASVFILAAGLLLLRLLHGLLLLLQRMVKRRGSAVCYAAVLQIARGFGAQSLLFVFLIMTIASGIFDASMARTVNENSRRRVAYEVGTDVRTTESWQMHRRSGSGAMTVWYDEPDFGRYEQLVADGLCESVTRVVQTGELSLESAKGTRDSCQLYAIHTREFGETARLQDGLNDTHWFYALNALAEKEDGAILSANAAQALGLSVGDSFSYVRQNVQDGSEDGTRRVSVTVAAIVDAFPGYVCAAYESGEDGVKEQEQYLIVVNYASYVEEFGVQPYTVWMRLAGQTTAEQVKTALADAGGSLASCVSMDEEMQNRQNAPLLQVTNGMFTVSFLISLLVCSAGFLLYWLAEIRGRALLYGIYRAMGMRMAEIRRMLALEQLFYSLLPMAAAAGAGALATALFVELIAGVYLPETHNVAITLVLDAEDYGKLALVLLIVILICFGVLRRAVLRLGIAQALKLGED